MTTLYVTKYALTKGPLKVEAEITLGGTMASYRIGSGYMQNAHGKDFWLTPEGALAVCECRRQAKIKCIEKQKLKLKKMQFTIQE